MNADLALSVGVLLGPGGLWMLQNPERRLEAPQLGERLALLERIAAGRGSEAGSKENGRK
jgi:hypothetical protein